MKSEVLISEKTGFAQKHGDTIAIIASTLGANIAIAAIMISMWASNTHRIDATNSRMDGIYQVLMNNAGLSLPNNTKQGE